MEEKTKHGHRFVDKPIFFLAHLGLELSKYLGYRISLLGKLGLCFVEPRGKGVVCLDSQQRNSCPASYQIQKNIFTV